MREKTEVFILYAIAGSYATPQLFRICSGGNVAEQP